MAKLSRRLLSRYVASELRDGKKASVVVKSLAAYLVDTRRTKELPLIIEDIRVQLAQDGIIEAKVISAMKLSLDVEKAIIGLIKEQTGAKSISLSSSIDPGIIAGVNIALPGQQLDLSVRRKLQQLRTNYKKA